jgi:hypothetical protein
MDFEMEWIFTAVRQMFLHESVAEIMEFLKNKRGSALNLFL